MIEHHHDDRHFKRETEGDEHRQHKAEVGVDVRREVHAVGREACDELEHHAEHDEVAVGHAHGEHHDRGDQNRKREALLAPVERRRHIRPQLIEHVRQRDEERHEERHLERHHERRHHARGQKLHALRQGDHERLAQEVEDLLHEGREAGEDDQNSNRRLDRAVAQFDQVADERLLVRGIVRRLK